MTCSTVEYQFGEPIPLKKEKVLPFTDDLRPPENAYADNC